MSGRATEESSLGESDRRRAGCLIINSVLFGVDPAEYFGKFGSKREEADRDHHYHYSSKFFYRFQAVFFFTFLQG
jgi:hypothetical protein